MDNGSNDGTDAMMREVYPEMTYRHLPENIGPLAFNKGAELASAPLLFRTDDDAYPEDTDTLERGVLFMEQRTNLAVLAGEIVDERTGVVFNWHPYAARYETIPEDGLDVGFFYGACAILRKGPFFEAGGFWDKFYLEEADPVGTMPPPATPITVVGGVVETVEEALEGAKATVFIDKIAERLAFCLLYTSPSPRD